MKIKKRKEYIFFVIFFIIVISLLFFFNINGDGMNQISDIKVYYRTYTDELGWSKWSKNGMTSGSKNKKYEIKNVQIRVKTKYKGSVTYQLYDDKHGWSNDLYYNETVRNRSIKGIRIAAAGKIYKKFDVYYRTYNFKDGWLEWAYDGMTSGNKNVQISAIQIKIIPKNVIEKEYLKDYGLNNKKINYGF